MMMDKLRYRVLALLSFCAAMMYCRTAWGVPVDGAAVSKDTMFDLIIKGGPVMIPLGVGSVLALAISVERFISLRRDRVIPTNFTDELLRIRQQDPSGKEAIDYCDRTGGAVGKIFKAGLQRLSKGEDAVEKAIEDAGFREADKMKRSLRGLSIIASVSPLLGLLGTVYGMISAFQSASAVGMGKSDVLAKGIYEALVTTAAGLTIAIPVLLLYQFLSGKVDTIVDDLDEMGMEFMNNCVVEVEETGA